MICDDDFHSRIGCIGKECDCAACYPNRDHGCPGCQICEGIVNDCEGPIDEEEEAGKSDIGLIK